MGTLSTNGSKKRLLINCSLQNITDPLETLISLQKIFDTDVFKGYESWRFTIDNHNLFCISTNKKGLYELVIKNGGYFSFFDSNQKQIKVDLSGETITRVLENFGLALSTSHLCEINTREKEGSSEKKFEFTIKKGKDGILRTSIFVENFSD